jgi:ATP-binding cassette subfamily B protein
MKKTPSLNQLIQLAISEKKDITNVYIFAIFSGIIQLSLPLGVQSIIGFVLGGAFSTSLIVLISLVIVGVLFSGMLQLQQMKIIEKMQQKLFHSYAFMFKKNLMELDLKKSDDFYFPEMMNRFLDISTLQKGFSKILLDIPLASIQILLGLLIVAIYHPLFLILVVIMLIIIIIIFYLTSKKGLETSIKESSYKYETTGWLEEIARMIHTFKLQRAHNLSLDKMDQKVSNYLEYRTKHFNILLFQFKNLIFLKIMITAAMLIVGTYLLIHQKLNIGQFVAAEIIILMMIASVEKIITNLDTFYDLLTSLDKLHTVQNQTNENDGIHLLPVNNKGMSIEFNNVSYEYIDQLPILANLNFKIEPGEKISISGKDGSGKSTLLRLFSSLYTPNNGSILFNRIPIQNLQLGSLRNSIGIMLNRLDIFKGTIEDNITMGNKSILLQKIIEVSKAIGLEEYINHTPKGFETIIETTGKKLPRSVIKKIMILRAIINEPSLILLEEPFSELQPESVEKIQHYILHNLPNSTVIVVSNDEPFIKLSDKNFHMHNQQLQINSKK